jgi:hypothetical protein
VRTILDIITPINIAEEREKFFRSSTYDPIFRYKWTSKEIQEFANKHAKYKRLTLAIKRQNVHSIVKEAQIVFETQIEKDYLVIAQNIVSSNPDLPNESISTKKVIIEFQRVLHYFDLSYSFTVVPHAGFNCRPIHEKKVIQVNEGIDFHFFSLDGLIKHEMTHILRYINGKHNKISRSSHYLPTEEGLASFMQDTYGECGDASLFQHAAEYTATEIGLKSSLRQIIEYFCDIGFTKELAWQRAIRHKFGFVDTSQSGDIMKPSMYFYTEQKLKKLPKDELLKLFVGKISLQEINKFQEYIGLIPQNKLISFFSKKSNYLLNK